ncbi:LacI family DNA-binding transcriptional regulator [Streptococcus thermophilus]|nr:LacI family DNA-binding transcriptional regulator [Streptococcus thermophilus]MCE2327971.1 LacI family DNA-binding transcriptional regulator [Streptococcus thermophilus]MCE2332666.1 LacI family DNA-binding transcriptional regulator [Streptococcus thermophilus]
MATIKDIVRRAGVIPSTISRTLKDNPSISKETKAKVRAAMDELGYVPNSAAQMLATGLTHSLGVVLPPLTDRENISQPFYMEIITAINEEASSNSQVVSIATGATLEELVKQVELMHRQKRADGFIILYSETNDPVKDYLLKEKVPSVVVGAVVDNNDKVTYIDNDNKELGQEAINFLRAKGHQKIGFVTDYLFGQVGQEHYQGYIEATNEFNLETYPELVFSSRVIDSLKESLQSYQLTALIVKDNLIALRFIHWLNNQGIRIPEDYAIISFNNSILFRLIERESVSMG